MARYIRVRRPRCDFLEPVASQFASCTSNASVEVSELVSLKPPSILSGVLVPLIRDPRLVFFSLAKYVSVAVLDTLRLTYLFLAVRSRIGGNNGGVVVVLLLRKKAIT